MSRTLIYGNGGHGRDIAHNLRGDVDFYDDSNLRRTHVDTLDLSRYGRIFIGVNDPRTRRAIAERHGILGGAWFHPDASIGPAVIIDSHVHINAGATITRSSVGAFTTISPGANICGDVHIGETVTIGAGAVICQFCVIGDGATIAAGAVLPPHTNVPCNETWGGVPARRLS